MGIDTAMALAALGLVLLIPLHQQLTIRALRHAIRQQHKQLHQHRRAIVQLQSAAVRPPTSIGQPMPSVTGTHRAVRPLAQGGGPARQPALWGREHGPELFVTKAGLRTLHANESPRPSASATDETLRLQRPPALTDLQHALRQAGRALTATEMAAKLGRQPWDMLPLIDRDMAAGLIRTVPGHTAGRTAYTLVDTDTLRMARMPVLPGGAR